jgi:hypothetical protein
MQLYGLLNEMLSGDVYHYTYPNAILNILKTNRINLSSNLGGAADQYGNKPFFLSFSRTGSFKLGYGKKGGDSKARIVFDGGKLNTRYKSIPVDYWGVKSNSTDINYRDSFEFEDRLLSDKPTIDNALSYIKRIDMVIKDMSNYPAYLVGFKKILTLAKQLNVPAFVYSNEKDATSNTNPINDQILNYQPEKDMEDREESRYTDTDLVLKIVALVLYDEKYTKEYDLFCKDMGEYLKANNIQMDIDCYKTFETMRNLYYNAQDFISSISSYLHNMFKSGRDGGMRDHVMLLVREMKKYKVQTIKDLVNIKTTGLKPKGQKFDYATKYALYEWGNDEWNLYDNNIKLERNRVYFNTWKYGGYLRDEDMDVYFQLRNENKNIGDFLNYLMNTYTLEKVKDIVHKSGYDNVFEEYRWKLDKI